MLARATRSPKRHRHADVRKTAIAYYEASLKGDRDTAASLRRRLASTVERMAARREATAAHWLTLADAQVHRGTRLRSLRQALRLSPQDAEAHAELAVVYAELGKRARSRAHALLSLRRCRGHELEDMILLSVYHAGVLAEMEDLARRTLQLGRRRFPTSPLFRGANAKQGGWPGADA